MPLYRSNSSVTTLNNEVATNTTNIFNNTASINTLNAEVSNLQNSISSINSEITSLQNGLAANAIPSTIETSAASGDYIFTISGSDIPYKITVANLLAGLSSSGSATSPTWQYKNSNYTASAGDLILADVSSGSFTVTLPSSPSSGASVTVALVKNNSAGANIVSITGSGLSPYISIYINPTGEVTLVYITGTGWNIIGSYVGVYPVSSFPVTPRYRFSAALQSGLLNGNSVSSISDSSSNSFTATASGTAEPTFQTNVINGYPALSFNGSTNYLTLGNDALVADPGDFVIFQVVKYAAAGCISFGGGANTSGNWGLQMGQSNDYAVAGGALIQTNLTLSLNTWYIKAFARLSNNWKSWVNGGSNISGGSNSGALRGVSSGYEQYTVLGAKWDGAVSNFTNGYLAETAIILSPTLANINSIGAYYASLYGLTWNTAS